MQKTNENVSGIYCLNCTGLFLAVAAVVAFAFLF